MLLVSFMAGAGLLTLYYGFPIGRMLFPVLLAAIAGTLVEMLSSSEWDTVTVPFAVLCVLLLMGI